MPDQLPPLVGVLKGNASGFIASLGEARTAASGAHSGISSSMNAMSVVGKAALFGIAGAALAVGAVSVHMAGDFQQSMTQLVTGAGESRSNIDLVSKGILSMAGEVGVSAQDIANGMYTVESAGYHGAAGLTVMKTAAEGAKVGGADMATVADALTTSLNAYHQPASQAVSITNDLIATVANGKMHMQDLASSLGTVLPAASAAHVSLAEVSGAIATMTMQGTPAADAATYLRQTILQMENPSAKAQKALKDVGLSSRQLAEDLGKKGLAATLQEATDAISKKFAPGSSEYVAHLADMVGGTKSMQAALELTGGNMTVFKDNVKAIGGAAAAGAGQVKGWSDTQKDFNFQVDQAKAQLTSMAIQLGMVLIPAIQKGIVIVGQITGYFKQHKDVAIEVAAAIAGPLVYAIGAFTVSMVMAAAASAEFWVPIVLIIGAIALLSAGVAYAYQHWGWFRNAVNAVGVDLKAFVGWLGTTVPPVWHGFTEGASKAWSAVKSGVEAVAAVASAIAAFVIGVPGRIGAFFSNLGSTANHAWHEFSSRPIYWITYLLVFIPAKLLALGLQVIAHLAQMVVSADKWASEMEGKAIGMAVRFAAAALSELPKLPGQAWDLLVRVIDSVGRWEDQMIAAGVKTAQDFGARFVTELEQLPAQMGTVGADLIKGLISGVLSMKDAAGNAVHQVVSGSIDAVKQAFGIHSPSSYVIEHIGVPLGQGVVVGINSQASEAAKAMKALVGGSMSPRIAGAAGQAIDARALGAGGGQGFGSPAEVLNELRAMRELLREILERGGGAHINISGAGASLEQLSRTLNRELTWQNFLRG